MDRDIITIGFHKGEIDFGVNASIGDLTQDQMDKLRIMTMVGIGQAEQMWARATQMPARIIEKPRDHSDGDFSYRCEKSMFCKCSD